MRKKLFTFLLALAASVGLSWATTITWDDSKVYSMAMNVSSGSDSRTSDGITVTAVSTGEFVVFGDHDGAIEIGNGEGSGGGYITFESSVGNITRIDINHYDAGTWSNANAGWPSPYYETFDGGTFTWSGTPAASVTLTGDAPRYIWGITSIEFTIEDGGGSTPAVDPTPTPSATGGIFANCYDCWRSPEYPTISGQCHLFNFGNPGVGNGNPSGPWKLEFVENYNSSSTEYDDIVSSYAANQYGKSPEQMEVYRLYQWQNGAYKPVAYGVLYAYANENNQVEHAAFFEANGYWGCYFTDNTHSGGDDFNITFNEDASTGFADLHGSTPTPTSSGDKLSGVFSISSTKAVNFSKGNLQYDSENQIWQFAANQWDYIGNAAGNNAITADGIADNNGIVDMFCWVGASSSLEGIKQYGIIKSWSGYGSVAGEALKSDWGNIMGGDWRTLSKDEWIYLLTERTNAANLRTLGTVNGKAGLILMPDGWTASGVALTVTTANYTTNDINTTNWATLEGQGCAFLPAAGCCMLGLFDGVGGDGSYWSSTSRDSGSTHAHRLHFRATDVDPTDFVERFTGMSVRLVSETVPTPTSAGLQVTELEIPASWENDQTLVTISDLPGFVAVSLEEAGAWDAVPAGDVVLIYAGTNEGVTATYFHNGAWGDPVPFGGFSRADIFEWASYGYKIFYTSGGSTPAVDPAVQNVIDLINAIPNPVAYNDDCKNAIDAARAAYDALTDAQNDLVENYGVLLDAETAYALLTPNPSGECGAQGDNLLWELNTSTGVLTITGSGAMYDWSYDTDLPWYDNRLQITSVVLPSGITSLGTKAFRGCQNLASINMTENYPAGLTAINQEAFCHTALTSVTIPESVVTIGQDAFYQSQSITDVYCYADPNNLTWTDFWGDDFASAKSTQCHVKDCYLEVYNSKWNTGTSSTDVNVTFVGDLPGECGGSTPAVDPAVQNVIDLINAIPNPVAYNDDCKNAIDAARAAYDALNADQKALVSNYSTLTDAEDAYAALIPVVTNYSISLDGITENADKVTLNKASAAEGETITLTPAAGYQITAFTASYASAYNVRVTADPNVDVYEASPYVGALPKEFTENVTPGLNGATFHSIEGNDPFTPVPASVLEYVGMNAAKDQMTIRVNDAFSGIIRVNYTYNVETCEWDEYEQQEICMGGTAQASVRVVCEAAGGVAPASKDDVTGAYSFTMPAGNVTITATVEAIPAPTNACGNGLTWELNDGVLTISYDGEGTGVMDDWGGYNEAPWSSEKLQITSVMLPEGITTIGSAAFRGCTNLASVNMAENFPASLTTIKTEAFYNSALTSVTIPANVVSIYSNVFYGCQSIANVYCYANPNDLVWMDGYCDDFKSGNKITQCHVKNCYLSLYNTKWNTGYELTDVNVTFVGDLPGDCGSSTFIDADFAINFMNDPYIVVGGGDLPEGVLVEGIPNKDLNHGYYNVIITIPAKAGTYKVTLGTCGWGLGNGTIQNENGSTTYASFNQHLADNDLCYHQDPTNNIVTAIFTLPEDQNIIVDCGEYTPYFSIEASSAPTTAVVIGDPNDADQVTAFLTTYNGQTIDELIIDRPVLNNMYNTLCLPFHMDADQIAASSLNGVEIYEFVDVDVTNDELYLYTSEEKHEIVAGRPYLVKFSAASQLNELNFIDVVINNADLDDQAVTIKGVTFKGTFQPIVLGAQEGLDFNGGHLFLMANNTLMWPNTNNPLKPFRAYFTVNVDAGQSAGMPVRRGMPAHIGGPAQIPTGVENVQGDNVQSTKVVENGVLYIIKNGVKYNAQGQIVK